MSAPRCKHCGHKRIEHQPQSENYDAPLECEHPDCADCPGYEPEEAKPPV
jgi:hypothetical protein